MTLQEAQAQLAYWYKCDMALAQGKTMTINGRSITLPNADEIENRISYWERKVKELKNINNNRKQSGVALADFNF